MPFSTKAILVGASVLAAAHLCQGAHANSCFQETLEFNEFLTNEKQCGLGFKLRTTEQFDSVPSEEDECKGTIGGVKYSFKGTTLKISMKCCDGKEVENNAAACKLKRDGTEVKVTRARSRRRLLWNLPLRKTRQSAPTEKKWTTTYRNSGSSAELTKLWFKGKASLGLGAESHLTHCLSNGGKKCAKDVEGYTNKIKSSDINLPPQKLGFNRRNLLQGGKNPRC
jgi:hypothetical protein